LHGGMKSGGIGRELGNLANTEEKAVAVVL
jgi:hypothetical protein